MPSDQVVEILSYIFEDADLSTEYIAMKAGVCHLPRAERSAREDYFLAAVFDRMCEESRARAREERMGRVSA